MTAHMLKTRRMALRDMGKAGLAVLVLGTAACADNPGEGTTTSSGAGDTTQPGSTTLPDATTTSQTRGSSTTNQRGTGSDWERVNLDFVSAYILYRSGEAALVDTGVAGSVPAIESALSRIGLGWDSVGHVIVTHKHPDHQGSLEEVLGRTPGAPWYAGAGDIAEIVAMTPGNTVSDGQTIFDLQIIETPGHTPGHLSVLDPAAGILVAGDALNGAEDGVVGANPDFSEDMALANASVRKLAGFDYEVALFGHGEPLLERAASAVSDLAAGLG
jgi:glyoxylase-like metal-dependent hydrolase (beta-lactamase superfamily II)